MTSELQKKIAAAFGVREFATTALRGSATSAPAAAPTVVSKAPERPSNLFADPDKLNEALERAEAYYTGRIRMLGQCGILIAGELPLAKPVSSGGVLGAKKLDSLSLTPWGKMADKIRTDERLRRALAALEVSEDGLPLIQPDLRAGSLGRQKEKGAITVYSSFGINGDLVGDIVPFRADAVTIEDDEAREAAFAALAKSELLKSGKLYRDGMAGISFIDAGATCPGHTFGMDMFTAVSEAKKPGLHVVSPEAYMGAQQLQPKGGELDREGWTWLDGYDKTTGRALGGYWYPDHRLLGLDRDDARSGNPVRGSRREARASAQGLEL